MRTTRKKTLPMKTHSRNYPTDNAVRLRFFLTFLECVARESSALFICLHIMHFILKNAFYKFYTCYISIHRASDQSTPRDKILHRSTTVFKQHTTQPVFLQPVTNSTYILICRENNLFIFSTLEEADICRTCSRGIYVCHTEKIIFRMFLWAFPFRSGYSGVPPSLFFRVAGSFLTCNVTKRLGQRCSLTIPNAEKRLPALLPGHLPTARDRQTERNTCTLSHGCTPFHCGIRLRRYGLLPIGLLFLVPQI